MVTKPFVAGNLVRHAGRLAVITNVREAGAETDDAYRYLVADLVYFLDQPVEVFGKYDPRRNQTLVTIPPQTGSANTEELTHVA